MGAGVFTHRCHVHNDTQERAAPMGGPKYAREARDQKTTVAVLEQVEVPSSHTW
jgi:hypothetical protein